MTGDFSGGYRRIRLKYGGEHLLKGSVLPVVVYRFVCAFAGQLVVSGLALTLAGYFGQGDNAKGIG